MKKANKSFYKNLTEIIWVELHPTGLQGLCLPEFKTKGNSSVAGVCNRNNDLMDEGAGAGILLSEARPWSDTPRWARYGSNLHSWGMVGLVGGDRGITSYRAIGCHLG